MAHLISWHRQNSSPLVSWCLAQTKLRSPPNSSSLPPLPDHRGCLKGNTCCSGVQLWTAWELPVFPSWLPRPTGNIVISHIFLMCPLWKAKRPLLCLCSLLEEQEPSSSSQPGTAGTVVFPPTNSHEMPLLPGTRSLSDPKPASPPTDAPMGPQKLEQAAVIHSPLELWMDSAACGGIAAPCVRGQPHSPVDQEVSASRSQNLL